jgi:radical SAM enzyme (TIGR01210 family)
MGSEDHRIRTARPPKTPVDLWQPIDVQQEEELLPDGTRTPALTVFLAGRECPFTCVYCDLWRFTSDLPTPPGAIPAQLRQALERHGAPPSRGMLKLYNSSNFFDSKAVPPVDDAEIAHLAGPFERVVVECHPRLLSPRCLDFADRLEGRLQVAMGLETAHPEALARLNKHTSLRHFERAASFLADADIELRAFVLVGAPFVPLAETVLWVERSVALAFDHGAVHVALVPVRGGPGEMEHLERLGHFTPPTLGQAEEAFERCLALEAPGVVTVDTWDLDRFPACSACGALRRERLARMNLSGALEPEILCHRCSATTVLAPLS